MRDRPSLPPNYDSAPEAFDSRWESYGAPRVRGMTFGDVLFGAWVCAFVFNLVSSFDNPLYANTGLWLLVCGIVGCVYAVILSVVVFLVARIKGA
jgi:hypothetical protein